MPIPPLILRIYADSSGVKRGIAQANAQVNGLRASVSRNAGLIGTALAVGLVAGTVKAVQAAGDLGEAVNANNVIFRRSAGIVRTWARQAASSAGLAEAEALQAAAGFGAMLDTAGFVSSEAANMSVALTQLAGDMGSLHNVDPTEMLEKIRSGLSGELEPLRRFGVDLSAAAVEAEAFRSGIAEVGDELTLAQKTQARYNIIMEQTTTAHGDFSNTVGESLPNQLRKLRAQMINLGATVGKVLLPAVTALVGWINNLIERGTEIARVLQRELGPEFRKIWAQIQRDVLPTVKQLWQDLKPVAALLGGALLNNLKAVGVFLRTIVVPALSYAAAHFRAVVNVVRDLIAALDALQAKAGGMGNLIPAGSAAGLFGRLLGRAHGGPVTAFQPYIVGERGPELFVPHMSGSVVPNDSLGQPQVINLYVGDEKVESVVVRALDRAAAKRAAS